MAFSVEYIIERLEDQGLFNIILPILLVFAIVYGILSKMNIFGDNDKINAVIAFVFGMYVTMVTEFALFLTNMTAGGMTILVGLLFFLMIVGFGSSLSGGSPTSILSDHKDAMTIALMLIGGIIFVNSGGLLVVGAYTVRIGFSDILSLTFLYVIYAVIKSLLGVGKLDHKKVRKMMEHFNSLADELDFLNSQPHSDHNKQKIEDLEREMHRLKKKMNKMGLDSSDMNNMINDDRFENIYNQFPLHGYQGRFGRKRRLY